MAAEPQIRARATPHIPASLQGTAGMFSIHVAGGRPTEHVNVRLLVPHPSYPHVHLQRMRNDGECVTTMPEPTLLRATSDAIYVLDATGIVELR
jgi:hypothetical protein